MVSNGFKATASVFSIAWDYFNGACLVRRLMQTIFNGMINSGDMIRPNDLGHLSTGKARLIYNLVINFCICINIVNFYIIIDYYSIMTLFFKSLFLRVKIKRYFRLPVMNNLDFCLYIFVYVILNTWNWPITDEQNPISPS